MYTVYKHTAPNGKVYIGITKQKPEKRWANGNGYKNNKYFYSAIRKYTWDNFKHEIICQAPMSAAQAGAVEKSFIAIYDSTNPDKGYNHSTGGECGTLGVHPSAETRRKLSEAHKGQTAWNKGVHPSYETRRKMSEAQKGHTAWIKGAHHSAETRQKISESCKRKTLWNQKAVICVESGMIYRSGAEAAKSIGVTKMAISNAVRGVQKTAGGYHWKYAD